MPQAQAIQAAYFYLIGRVYAIRQERIDVAQTPYNAIKYNPLGAGSADFVNPNLDVAYWEAWIAADAGHAVVLHVPRIEGRYYTVQILDGWGEVIANVNPRGYPDHPWGKVAFVKAGTAPKAPPDALVIELPAGKAKVLARVELSSTPQEAAALQRAFVLDAPQGIYVEPAPAIPAFDNPQLPGAWVFAMANQILDSYPDRMPDAPRLARLARDIAVGAADDAVKAQLQNLIDTKFTPYFFREVIKGRGTRNGWSMTDFGGRFGSDYLMRALVNYGGIWANVPEEVVYYTTRIDGDGEGLTGSGAYALRFEKDALPDAVCDAFWSITALRLPDYRVAPNEIDRYTINNVSGAKRDQDGSLTLYLAPAPPRGAAPQNWLPVPQDIDFCATFRLYVPKQAALSKAWSVPPLKRIAL